MVPWWRYISTQSTESNTHLFLNTLTDIPRNNIVSTIWHLLAQWFDTHSYHHILQSYPSQSPKILKSDIPSSRPETLELTHLLHCSFSMNTKQERWAISLLEPKQVKVLTSSTLDLLLRRRKKGNNIYASTILDVVCILLSKYTNI